MANIAINDVPFRAQYTATGGQTMFAVPFPYLEKGDVLVYKRADGAEPDDVADLLTLTTDYTLTDAGVEAGGTMTLNVGATANDVVTIWSGNPIDRTSIYNTRSRLTRDDLNLDFEALVIYVKQLEEKLDSLVPSYEISSTPPSGGTTLPTLGVDEIWVGTATGVTTATNTSAITTPSPSTDNALVRFDGTTGKAIQNSVITADDAGVVTGVTQLNVDNLRMDGDTISNTAANTDITVAPNGTGRLALNANPTANLHAATKQYVDSMVAGSDNIDLAVNEVAHGFVVGDVLYMQAGGTYAKAQADAVATSEAVGIVTAVADVDNYTLTLVGYIDTGLAGLTPGQVQYLSTSTAGDIQTAKPTVAGQVIKPLMIALSATTAIWVNHLGVEI